MKRNSGLVIVLGCMALALSACGDSGESRAPSPPGSSNPPPTGEPPPEEPSGDLTVAVNARDAFGATVPDAEILLLYSSGTGFWETGVRTDAHGSATIDRAPDNAYAVILAAEGLYGSTYEATEADDKLMLFDVTLHPSSSLSPGVGRVEITDVSADATRLTFSARLYIIETYADELPWYWSGIDVLPCESCIEGPGNFSAAYTGQTLTDEAVEPDSVSEPLAIGLLLDQGASVMIHDLADKRLLGAKYLPTRLAAEDMMALAAFAADDAGTGQASLLPSQPVTIFPVDSPSFTSDGRSYFPAIESLATLEGGGSPLYDALGEMVSFTDSAAPADSRRAVVAVSSYGAGDCGDLAECSAAQQALLEQSESTGVGIVSIELADPIGRFDSKRLGPLAQAEQGTVFWANDADQIPTILGRLPEVLDGRHTAIDVTIQLASPVAGAFAPGNTVDGTLRVMVCPWDCDLPMSFPFGLRVPLR
jgi:hypothetical protein